MENLEKILNEAVPNVDFRSSEVLVDSNTIDSFDIISIRYSQGGVSSNGNSQIAREVGDLIKKTRDLYRNSDSLHNRRYVEFLNLAYSSKNKYERYINYLKYLDIFLCHQYYLYCEKRRGKKDLKYYKLLINK